MISKIPCCVIEAFTKEYILDGSICKSNLQWKKIQTVIASGASEDKDRVGRSTRELSGVIVTFYILIGV